MNKKRGGFKECHSLRGVEWWTLSFLPAQRKCLFSVGRIFRWKLPSLVSMIPTWHFCLDSCCLANIRSANARRVFTFTAAPHLLKPLTRWWTTNKQMTQNEKNKRQFHCNHYLQKCANTVRKKVKYLTSWSHINFLVCSQNQYFNVQRVEIFENASSFSFYLINLISGINYLFKCDRLDTQRALKSLSDLVPHL